MSGRVSIRKNFAGFLGRDTRSTDLTRPPEAAIEFSNADFLKDGTLTNRTGGKILAPDAQFLGVFNYAYSDQSTGETRQEIISISDSLYKKRSNTLTITYTGSGNPVQLNIKLDASTATFKATIVENTTTVLNYDLGTGLETSPITLANLITQINAISGFSASASGITTIPAAFLPTSLYLDLANPPKTATITYYDWQTINSTVSTPFASYYAARGDSEFRHASAINVQDCLFIATGKEYLHKFDGQTVYRVGAPEPTAAPTVATAAGALAGTYRYISTHIQYDNQGNIVEGTESDQSANITPATNSIDVTVSNVQAGSGYNTNCALFAANAAVAPVSGLVTLTVQNTPHTMKAGDTAYFYNRALSQYKTYTVSSVTTTTLVLVSTDTITTNNNDVCSNNLRTAIYRTKNGGIDFFLVAEIPNNSFAATQVYNDNAADTALGAQYLYPEQDHDALAVKPNFVVVHQGVVVVSGILNEPNTVYYSSGDGVEYFPLASNSFDIPSTTYGSVTGIGSLQDHLLVGKRNSLYAASGDLAEGAFRVEKISEGRLGIASHNTICDMGRGLVFLSDLGFWMVDKGLNTIEIGANINKEFSDPVIDLNAKRQTTRAWGIFYDKFEKYMCFVPCESGTGTGRYANGNSVVHFFDVFDNAWGKWSGLNMGGGICVHDNYLWWQSKRDAGGSGIVGNLWQESATGSEYDFADHNVAIECLIQPQWDFMGDPSVFKLVPRVKFYNLSSSPLSTPFEWEVTTEVDFLYGVTHSDFDASFNVGSGGGGFGWGYMPWGLGAWGSPVVRYTKPLKLKVTKLKAIRFKLRHATLHQNCSITGWEYEMVEAYKPEMKS